MPIKVAESLNPAPAVEPAPSDPSRFTVSLAGAELPPLNSLPQRTAEPNKAPVLFDPAIAEQSARKASEAERLASAAGPLPEPDRKEGRIAVSLYGDEIEPVNLDRWKHETAGPEWLSREQQLRESKPSSALDGYGVAAPASALGWLAPGLTKYIPEGLTLNMELTELGGGVGYQKDFTPPQPPDAILSSKDKLRNRVIVQDRPIYPNDESSFGSTLTAQLADLSRLETRLSLPTPAQDSPPATPLDEIFSYEGKAVEMVIKIQREAGLKPNGITDRATLEAIDRRKEYLQEQLRKYEV